MSQALSEFTEWNARDYLGEYYGEVMDDERHALAFLVDAVRDLPRVARALDIGCGPCVHHSFALVPHADEIHLADYVAGNLDEIERWRSRRPGAHDWSAFTAETLGLEGASPSADAIARREDETRARLTRIVRADVRAVDPMGPDRRASYPLVTSHYCAEAISTEKSVFRSNVANLASLIEPGGTFVLSTCGAADSYKVGERRFPCSGVTPTDVLSALLAVGFRDVDLRVRSTPSHTAQGYASVIFARASRPRD